MRLSIEEPQTYVAEAPCQQPKQRLKVIGWLAAAAANESFYDVTRACDWMIESPRIKTLVR